MCRQAVRLLYAKLDGEYCGVDWYMKVEEGAGGALYDDVAQDDAVRRRCDDRGGGNAAAAG